MNALKIICFVLGILFTVFGYLIRYKKKYNLINGFKEDFKHGKKTEKYAIKVGTVELRIGIILLILSLAMIVFL